MPLLEVLVPMREHGDLVRVQESHAVLELGELVHLYRLYVGKGLPEPLGRLRDVLELDLQDGEGETIDIFLTQEVRGDVAPGLAGVTALHELVEQGHLRVQGDPDLIAGRELEGAPVVGRPEDGLHALLLDHRVHLVADALHGLPGLCRVRALCFKLLEAAIDVEPPLHVLEDVTLRQDAALLRRAGTAPTLVVDLPLHVDLLVRLQVVLAVPPEAHKPGALFTPNALGVAHAVRAVEVHRAQQLRLLHGARVCSH
mmetsp:Transcript_18035/g.40733  ORF Transcript_18035/g.40733 Transcript_18035/m.40733 type:complete len:256 (+) Transcript_18035:106-873(+)